MRGYLSRKARRELLSTTVCLIAEFFILTIIFPSLVRHYWNFSLCIFLMWSTFLKRFRCLLVRVSLMNNPGLSCKQVPRRLYFMVLFTNFTMIGGAHCELTGPIWCATFMSLSFIFIFRWSLTILFITSTGFSWQVSGESEGPLMMIISLLSYCSVLS